jgi:hypothetical protein
MGIRNEDVAVGRDQNVTGLNKPVESGLALTGDSQGHQHLALRTELDDDIAFAAVLVEAHIRHPDIAFAVDVDPVRGDKLS